MVQIKCTEKVKNTNVNKKKKIKGTIKDIGK